MTRDRLVEVFTEMFGNRPAGTYFCPGRVNLIGEHTDYNGGLVMPCALNTGTWLLIAPNVCDKFRFRSLNDDYIHDIPVESAYQPVDQYWFNYPLGVIDQMSALTPFNCGYDMLFYGTMPVGAGLSSSASIEVVTAFALNDLISGSLTRLEIVKISQSAENDFIGVQSGIMDQFAVSFGEIDRVIMLDCAKLTYEQVDINLKSHSLVIINSNKPRQLSESAYNQRVVECSEALSQLQTKLNISSLCEVTSELFYLYKDLIQNPVIQRRARHVIEENERVKLASKALKNGDLESFGKLLNDSHRSLKDYYEVSCSELDALAEYSRYYKGVLGAKMTGAGFGGCVVALVKTEVFEEYRANLTEFYKLLIGYEPTFYLYDIGKGVHKCFADQQSVSAFLIPDNIND